MKNWELKALEIQGDPSIHFWVKSAIKELLTKDPIDAAVDAEIVFELMDERAKEILEDCPNLTLRH
jgi:hypothetical protein